MRNGDRAGLPLLRDSFAWTGAGRDSGATRMALADGLTMDGNRNTTGTGTEVASAIVPGGRVRLRTSADIHPGTCS